MKLIDKFLKKLNTNRNTFATFILTLITIYICVDRIVEMLLMMFSGVSVSYWGPIRYTLALACPTFAYLFSGSSSFASSNPKKTTLFYTYMIGLYIIGLSMITQWLNMSGWLLFMLVPNYSGIVSQFQELIRPAFIAISIYLPLVSIMPFIKWIVLGVNDSDEMQKSIWDYKGINLSDTINKHNQYECNLQLFTDAESGKKVTLYEGKRFQPLLVCGGSGSGKTALIFEPFIAKDLEKKLFFSEISKEMGYTALKTGLATLDCPYDNDYLNGNFSLSLLKPASGREDLYKSYMKKMLLSSAPFYYKNLGLTYLAPDIETISHVEKVCKNMKLQYNLIDPSDPESIGMNPFVYDDASKIAETICSVLLESYVVDQASSKDSGLSQAVFTNFLAIENLIILLKEVYPRMNQGALPNLDDMLKLLVNYELIERMCQVIEKDSDLSLKYSATLEYFKRNFYSNSSEIENTKKSLAYLTGKLDTLLRLPGIKNTLCNRYNNINCDKLLSEGQITLICTRRGALGPSSHKAFGLFFLISLQNSILRRPGSEFSRMPHFLYIDEFPEFMHKSSDAMFTMYRKYRVACTISIQSITQLGTQKTSSQTILANCANKIFTGNATPEECEWWEKEFGAKRKWKITRNMNFEKLEYDTKAGVKYDWDEYFKAGKLSKMGLKSCAYMIRKDDNKPEVGEGSLSFLDSKYKEERSVKKYNFTMFSSDDSSSKHGSDYSNDNKRKKFRPEEVSFEDALNEINPIQYNPNYLFDLDNDDAIVFDLKKPDNE